MRRWGPGHGHDRREDELIATRTAPHSARERPMEEVTASAPSAASVDGQVERRPASRAAARPSETRSNERSLG